MALLSDVDIRTLLGKEIIIEPFSEECLTPVGYDFSVGEFVYSLEHGLLEPLDGFYELPPKSTIQILTKESLWVSKRIAGTFHSKVSLASKGLAHIATTLDPEWYGPLLITTRNNTDKPIQMAVADTFVTLLFYELLSPTEFYHWRSYRKILQDNLENARERQLSKTTKDYIDKITRVLDNAEASGKFARLVDEAHQGMQEKVLTVQNRDIAPHYRPVAVKIKRIHQDASLPEYAYRGDSGADILSVEDCILQPLERRAIATGLTAEIPVGFELQVRPRSGLALKNGITVLNTPGTIDSGYRGEIKVILINLGPEAYQVAKGQKIAQLVLAPVYPAIFEDVDQLAPSERDTGGFGSTGASRPA
jgi:dUTP pyrophosphatase